MLGDKPVYAFTNAKKAKEAASGNYVHKKVPILNKCMCACTCKCTTTKKQKLCNGYNRSCGCNF